jgi:GNAT superfamily N-acetyltransferase
MAFRLVVSRSHAGRGIGAALLDWAGKRAARQYDAKWIRVDAWTTNKELHAYYKRQGFALVRTCPDPTYPSGAMFQKPTSE